MINRKHFYTNYRKQFGVLSTSQAEGLEFLLTALDSSEKFNLATQYAWILGMLYHECANTWQPVQEAYWLRSDRIAKLLHYYQSTFPGSVRGIFPNGTAYPTYEGRGYAQITLKGNYIKFRDVVREKFGVDILSDPDKVLDKDISWFILETGISERKLSFAGHILTDYVNDNQTDYLHARQTVNGMYRAALIAEYASEFYNCIDFSEAETPEAETPEVKTPEVK